MYVWFVVFVMFVIYCVISLENVGEEVELKMY